MKNQREPEKFTIQRGPAGSVAQIGNDFLMDSELRRKGLLLDQKENLAVKPSSLEQANE